MQIGQKVRINKELGACLYNGEEVLLGGREGIIVEINLRGITVRFTPRSKEGPWRVVTARHELTPISALELLAREA